METGRSIPTERLILKPQSLNDFSRYYAMSKDPAVMAFIGDGEVFHWNRAVAFARFQAQLAAPADNKWGPMAIYRRRDDLYLGWSAIDHSAFLNHVELGYRLCRDGWGRGYATEATVAHLREAYLRTDLDTVQACVHPDNIASIRVLEKIGFTQIGTKLSKPIHKEIPVYQVDRAAFVFLWGDVGIDWPDPDGRGGCRKGCC